MSFSTVSPTSSPMPPNDSAAAEFRVWMCAICGVVYREQDGWPEEGIAPGTRWADVPDEWICPECGAGKSDFEMTEA